MFPGSEYLKLQMLNYYIPNKQAHLFIYAIYVLFIYSYLLTLFYSMTRD